jgi:hypothetical protein
VDADERGAAGLELQPLGLAGAGTVARPVRWLNLAIGVGLVLSAGSYPCGRWWT